MWPLPFPFVIVHRLGRDCVPGSRRALAGPTDQSYAAPERRFPLKWPVRRPVPDSSSPDGLSRTPRLRSKSDFEGPPCDVPCRLPSVDCWFWLLGGGEFGFGCGVAVAEAVVGAAVGDVVDDDAEQRGGGVGQVGVEVDRLVAFARPQAADVDHAADALGPPPGLGDR